MLVIIGRRVFSETPSDPNQFVAVSSQLRKQDRRRAESGQFGYGELSAGNDS